MTCKLFFYPLIFLLALSSCRNSVDKDTAVANEKADSLSIKLNSPELKMVNAELLKEPSNGSLYQKRANVYMLLRQFPEAEGDAKRAIKMDSTRDDFFMTLADIYFAENKTKLAKETLEMIEKKFPPNSSVLLKLSELYFLVQKYQEAIDYANKALKIDQNLAQGYYLKGNIYKESGDTAKAISNLVTTTEQDSRFKNAFQDLGVIYAARKNPLAFEYYNNALKLDPDNTEVKYGIAKLLQDLGKIDEAIVKYDEIIASDNTCKNCCYNLGAIYLQLKKDNKKAAECFTKAIHVDPNYVEAYLARGFSYAGLRDKASAKADYEMCLKLFPNYPPAIQGLNELK
jgi:tetratricopeptide (TPR) repeat protein